jgi:serine/threonine-protein kinase
VKDNWLDAGRRTRLLRVLLVYLGGSFAALEAIELFSGKVELPDWVFSGAVVLLLIGLPIMIATALIQSAGPTAPAEGSGARENEDHVSSRASGARGLFTWRHALTGGVVAFALWGIAVTGWLLLAGDKGSAYGGRTMLVVLPFENLSGDQDEYFADGITDAITARIASLQGLGVISRQSAVQYKRSAKTAQEIGEDLGVDFILEGTIQRERPGDPGSRVRVIPQLIRIADDTHMWAATYDEDMSEVFRVQSEIAERVAQALNVTLLEPERELLESKPTDNLAAYDYYLRGNEYLNRGQLGYLDLAAFTAVDLYEKALELDPEFALAWAALARAHAQVYENDFDNTDERLERAREAAQQALHLYPDLPEGHLALGEFFALRHDYESALHQFESAGGKQSGDAELLRAIANVLGNQNRWNEAALKFRSAAELDPRSAGTAYDLGNALYRAGRYEEADVQFDRAILLAPDRIVPYVGKLELYINGKGDSSGARAVVEAGSQRMGRLPFAANLLSQHYSYFRVLGDDYAVVLDELSVGTFGHDTVSHFFYHLAKGELARRRARPEAARASYDSARVVLENGLRRWPNDAFWHRELGVAYAGLGRKREAIIEARRAVELVPPSVSAVSGGQNAEALAQIYAILGEGDAAVDQLESLREYFPWVGAPYLRVDPVWGPIRDNPRFKDLSSQTN